MTELPTAPETELVSTFWVTWKLYGKTERSGRITGTQDAADTYKRALEATPGVTEINIEWER